MKKAILLAMITVITTVTVFTSAKAQQGFYAGVHGAALVSAMYNETDAEKAGADYHSKLGTSFGVSGGYNFNRHFGVGTEVNYSTLKQRYTNSGLSYSEKFNYLKIPVLFTYNTNPDRKFIFTAKAGPQLGILLGSRISNASNTAMNGSNIGQYKKLTYGAMAGAGVRMRLTEKIYLDGGIRLDGTFSNTEGSNHKNHTASRSKTHDLNGGLEFGIKYFF